MVIADTHAPCRTPRQRFLGARVSATSIKSLAKKLASDGIISTADGNAIAAEAKKQGVSNAEKIALAKVLDDYESLANNKAKRAIRLCVSPVVYLGTNPVKAQSKVESVVLDDTDFRAIAARKNANGKPEMLLIVATKKAIPLYQAILKAAVPNFDAKVQQGQPSILTPGA
jgi:hypothetical protein